MLAGLGLNIAEESSEAAKIKKADDIMVVLGNPPYSNFGQLNKGEWITELLNDYKKGLNEKKLNLDDDFIKFIRYGQWRIEKTGEGVLAFITNNTFIDGITHRQMRKSLVETFNDIYIFNLHGSSKKKEKSPNGLNDENVFDIQQGVSINIFIKNKKNNKYANVYFSEVWGNREEKYKALKELQMHEMKWEKILFEEKNYFFIPKDFSLQSEYDNYLKFPEIFRNYSSGIQTKRDNIAIAFSRTELINVLKDFSSLEKEKIRTKYSLPLDGRDWTIADASEHAKKIIKNEQDISQIFYRPFDTRWTVRVPVKSHSLTGLCRTVRTRKILVKVL